MSYEEFQQLARLFVVGSLDEEEAHLFWAGREAFGERAEEFIDECRKLNSVFALSLRPRDPDPKTKEKLFALIRNTPRPNRSNSAPSSQCKPVGARIIALEGRFLGRN